ncbi:MAG: ribulose-phosphate 3-epimerase [Dehalococcoidia bacterium]|nr:ribulose-phosphate 3-epimerase [Dehalococcoidia bacterium]
MRKVRVIPALLTDDTDSLARMVASVNSFADFVQIDIMDGRFVPSRSITAGDLKGLDIRFGWEAHLMVSDPLNHVEQFKNLGARRVIFHLESDDDPSKVITLARRLGVGIGVALNPDTPVELARQVLPDVDNVLLMSVHPGYYGAPFVPEVVAKIGEVRQLLPGLEIGMDGGIKPENLVEVAREGLDTVCVGSAIFRATDPAESYRRLSQLASQV